LVGLTIFTFYYAETAFSDGNIMYFYIDCKNTDWFKQIDDGVLQADKLFCSAECPCDIKSSNFTDQRVLIGKIIESNQITNV